MSETKDTPEKIVDDLQDAAQPDFGCYNAEANLALEPFRKAPVRIQALIDEALSAKAALLDEAVAKLEMVCHKWTFNNDQQHTHSWHDWADCVPEIKAFLAKVK